MKTTITIQLFLFLASILSSFSQETYVPDDNFEAYLEANDMGNGVPNDDYVTTANITDVSVLLINGEDIADLTGIEDFTNLINLSCEYNELTTLDCSSNHELEVIRAHDNQLTSIQIGVNTNLVLLDIAYNQLTSIDIAAYTALTNLYVNDNDLTLCNIANGNNTNMTQMWAFNNSALTCIQVDDAANTPPSGLDWDKDASASYSNSCAGVGVDELIENQVSIYPNPTSDFIYLEATTPIQAYTIYTILGEKIKAKSVNNKLEIIDVKNLKTGIYIIKVKVNNQIICREIIINNR